MSPLAARFDAIDHPRILVVGDLILDRYTSGNADRVSPEAPVIVLKADAHEARLGGAASVAGLLRGLDAEVALAGVVGDDANGRVLRRLLVEAGIDDRLVLCDPSRPTTVKERFIGRAAGRHPHQILRVDDEVRTPLDIELQSELLDRILGCLPEFQAVLISDYDKGVCQAAEGQGLRAKGQNEGSVFGAGWREPPGSSDVSQTAEGQGLRAEGQNEGSVFGAGWREPPGSSKPSPSNTDSSDVSPSPNDRGAHATPLRRTVPGTVSRRLPWPGLHPSVERRGLLDNVMGAAEDRGIPVIVDPARLSDYGGYHGALVLKPNRIEAELATGTRIVTPQDAIRAGDLLCQQLGLQAAVITLDRDGMVLCRPGHPGELFPTQARDVYDITGAGDMGLAMLGLALANPVGCITSRPASPLPVDVTPLLPDAVRLANIASGLEVERWGVTAISREEIRTELQKESGEGAGKLASLDELAALAERCRRDGRSVVITNGCFDLLHVGHVSLLEDAARLGDVLIVAINSDASVRKLKGSERPIIGETDRARMLAALACVDHVLIFDDDTPHRLLESIRPDVLVKGGTTGHIVGREIVEAYGGRIVRTSPVAGLSTTALVQRIRPSAATVEAT